MVKGDGIYIQELVGFELLYKAISALELRILFRLFLQMLANSCLDGQKMDVAICVSFKCALRFEWDVQERYELRRKYYLWNFYQEVLAQTILLSALLGDFENWLV